MQSIGMWNFFRTLFSTTFHWRIFSNQPETVSWCPKCPCLSQTQYRQTARTSPLNQVAFLHSEATILTSQPKVSVKQGTPVQIDIQLRGGYPYSYTWSKDSQGLPSGWSAHVLSIRKPSAVHSDIGSYTLSVSTPSLSNPFYRSTTATTTLDVLGK